MINFPLIRFAFFAAGLLGLGFNSKLEAQAAVSTSGKPAVSANAVATNNVPAGVEKPTTVQVAPTTAAVTKSDVPPVAGTPSAAQAAATANTGSSAPTKPVRPGSIFNSNNQAVPAANLEPPLTLVGSNPKALSLDQCFNLAAVRSDTLQINQQSITLAKAQYSQALAGLFPTMNFVTSHAFQGSLSGHGAGSGGVATTVGNLIQTSGSRPNSASYLLTVSQTLFDGGAVYNHIGEQGANIEAQKYNLKASYLTLYQEVAQSFYQILMSEGDILVTQDGIHALEEEVKTEEHWVKIGRALPSDLLTTQASLASARVTLEQIRGTLAADRELMAFYLGVPSEKIALRETQKFPSQQDLEQYLSVLGLRPDILSYVAQVREAEYALYASKGALAPRITVNGSYILASDPAGRQKNWQFSFQMNLPIFDGGLIVAQIRQQKAMERQSELNLENVRRTDDQNLRTAYASFNASVAQVVQLQEDVKLTALSYNAEEDEYTRGIVTNLNLLSAFTALQNARQLLNDAEINARLNLINLHVASGLAPTSAAQGATASANNR